MIIKDHLQQQHHQQSGYHRKDAHSLQQASSQTFGPYDEESHLTLTCELGETGEPQAQISWWQLKSVSMVPSSTWPANQRPARPLESLPSDGGSSNDTSGHYLELLDFMTTITLQEDNQSSSLGELEGEEDVHKLRDYFVGFYSNPADAASTSGQQAQHNPPMVLPFTNGYRLRHWARVKDQPAGSLSSSSDGRIQSSLKFSSLTRANLGDEFMCLAQNNDFSAPLNSTLRINLNRELSLNFDQ